jgi:UDP-glucose 4-epimerase
VRVVVTGGAGFIGSHVVDALVARGDAVTVIDDLSYGSEANLDPAADFHKLDIRSAEAAELLIRVRPQAVTHLAAQMSVSVSVREPVFDAQVNVLGSLNMMEAARQVGAKVVFASTGGAIYGLTELVPTPETSPALPIAPYGVAKLAVERYLYSYQVQHGLDSVALRFANVYGPRQTPHGEAGVVAIFARAMLSDGEAVINGDGHFTRDYVYVADTVRAVLLSLDGDENGIFNVGTGREVDVNEVFRMLVHATGVSVPERHGPDRPGDVRRSAVDANLIAARLGWRPEVTLEEGVQLTVDWFRGQLADSGLR